MTEDEELKAMGVDYLATNASRLWDLATEDERLTIAESLAMARQHGYSLAKHDTESETEMIQLFHKRRDNTMHWFLCLNQASLDWAHMRRHCDTSVSVPEEVAMGLCTRLMTFLVEELTRDDD